MLNVLICAFEAGINQIAATLPKPNPKVNFFISWQGIKIDSLPIPPSLKERQDVKITRLEGRGLSRNRNNCIKIANQSRAKGLFLIADEDVEFLAGFDNIIETSFRNHAEADIICFQVSSKNSSTPFKNYPAQSHQITLRSIDRISSIEITGRMELLQQVRFDERLGLGSEFPSGEETAFLADCIRAGRKIVFQPISIVSHPYETSGKKRVNMFSDEDLHLIGGRAFRIYGSSYARAFFIYSAIKNYPIYHQRRSVFSYLGQLFHGMNQFKKLKNNG